MMPPPIDQLARDLLRGRGCGVRIGLLDTGAESAHPDLVGRIFANYEIRMNSERGEVVRVAEGSDANEHGTACADILSRLAPAAEIHSIQVISGSSGDSPRKLMTGIRFALDQGWDIINISAGAARDHAELHELVKRAAGENRIVIAAIDSYPGGIGYPASYPQVIAVDMAHVEDPLGLRRPDTPSVDVEAKGVYVRAARAGGGRRLYTGSSFATPHVSAIAARLKERLDQLDIATFREAIGTLARGGEPIGRAAG